MSLKSIRQNYTKLIAAFESAGVKLDESQKSQLDTFIVALESKIDNMKQATVKATKKIVTEHLDKEYRKVFESILKNQAKHDELVSKIQNKVNAINESKKMARKVDNYLTQYVESILPEKTIVDYNRMKKLEMLHESLKDLMLVNEDAVENKKEQLEESFKKQKRDYETTIAKLQVRLNESMKKQLDLSGRIDRIKAKELLESKLADLPDFEANQIRKRLAEATTSEVKGQFKQILESVKSEVKEEAEEEEKSLDEEIKEILDCDSAEKTDEAEKAKKASANDEVDDTDVNDSTDDADDADVEEDDDDIQLSEAEKINADQMKLWCDMAGGIQTKGY